MSADARTSNAVFTSPSAQQPAQPTGQQPTGGDELPYETIPLPSRGLLYPDGSPLHGVDTVHIKSMTAREEDILMSPALIKAGTAITALIRSCLVDKRIDPADMIAGDRNALVFAIRITGYGHEYDATVECPECDEKTKRTFDLSRVDVNFLDLTPVKPFENRFEFALPMSHRTVNFRFLTGRAEESAQKTQQARRKAIGPQASQTVTDTLRDSIVSVDGIEDRQKIADFVRGMPARDSLALRQHISQHQPDIITRQESTCPSCGRSEEVSIPMGLSFLWPNAR
jgi:hypothetical protein